MKLSAKNTKAELLSKLKDLDELEQQRSILVWLCVILFVHAMIL